jgi:hypothetical protein
MIKSKQTDEELKKLLNLPRKNLEAGEAVIELFDVAKCTLLLCLLIQYHVGYSLVGREEKVQALHGVNLHGQSPFYPVKRFIPFSLPW